MAVLGQPSALFGEDREAQRALLAAARLERIPLQVAAVVPLLRSVKDAALGYLLSVDSPESRAAIRKHLGASRFRFATAEELLELTGVVPGCVPPFGRPILPLDLYVDSSILENDRIAFNAGSLTDSMIMDRATWMEIARPADVFRFSR